VRTVVGIDAGAGKAEAFDRAAVEEVLLDDLFGVAGFGEAVPDGVGIDDEDGPVLALVEAAGLVDANAVLEAGGFDGILEGATKFLGMLVGAAGAGRLVALVETDEDVVFEGWHTGIGCRRQGAEIRRGWKAARGHGVREWRIWPLMI
jgi:hypothetical protein